MPSESSAQIVDRSNVAIKTRSNLLPADDERTRATATKRAATLLRRKEERRADRLAQMDAQIADGTLIIRRMSGTSP
jgi:hypothetical protein